MSRPISSLPILLLVLLAGTSSNTVLAQSAERFDAPIQDDDALSFKLGETDLFPSLRIDVRQNSNAFLAPNDEVSATDVAISPEVRWVADRRLVTLEGFYQGEYNVSSEDALNYADHRIGLNAEAQYSSRQRLTGDITLEFEHEELGRNLTRGSADEDSDTADFIDFQADAEYRYGAANARGNISVGLFLQNLNYTSRDDVTSGRDFTRIEPYAEFSFRLSGDTRFLTQVRFGNFTFDNDARDRNDLSLLAGLQFNATGKTGGTVRLGVLQSQRDLSTLDDETEFVARASVFWEPTSFSRFDVTARRELDNTGGAFQPANTVTSIEDLIRVTWNHSWSSRVSHVAVIESENFDRACPSRDDNTILGSLEFNVQIRRWLSVGFSGSATARDVSDCAAFENGSTDQDYQRTRLGAHIRAIL